MDREGGETGRNLLGIFLLICGVVILMLGGGCTLLWIGLLGHYGWDRSGIMFLLLSLVTAAGGIGAILLAIRLLRNRNPR